MLCRVWYKPDGQVAVTHPAPKARLDGETDQEFLDRVCVKTAKELGLEGLDYDDVEPSTLPNRKDRDKWRGNKATGLQVDASIITQAERRQAIEAERDAILDKPVHTNKDLIDIAKLNRKLDKRDY